MLSALEAVDDHLQAFFPEAELFVLQDGQAKGPTHIDLHVVMPTDSRPYFVLVTSGMSRHPMAVPPGMEESAHAECFLCLPPHWPLSMINQGWRQPEFAWPFFLLQEIARFPYEQDTWLGFGHSVPIPHALDPAGRFSGVSLLEPLLMPEDFIVIEPSPSPSLISHPSPSTGENTPIWLLPVLPCTPEEMTLKRTAGQASLAARFRTFGVTELLDPNRVNVALTH